MYTRPFDVKSPKSRVQLVKVLFDGGEEGESYAVGYWDDSAVVLFRWNGDNVHNKLGNPQSHGYPTWIVLGHRVWTALIADLPDPDLRAFAKTFLNSKNQAAA